VDKSEVLEIIRVCGIVPAVRVNTEAQALRALDALEKGGLRVAELTMDAEGAAHRLESGISKFGDRMVLGAGTVLDADTARIAILAGAKFIVSPVVDPATIEICRKHNVAVFPGALTPTEILNAWKNGADCVKVFPASSVGGPAYIHAIKVPLPQIELMPMGGVSLDTVAPYLKAGSFVLGVGSDLVDVSDLGEHGGSKISKRAMEYRSRIEEARAKDG
jgi:2-dehydro-3-deoxyphosphogluconate aldolase/(4S)-4-hydroxy-2-oxoglutarate aldolase